MRLWQTHPMGAITLARGEGCTVWDEEGKRYLDMESGVWAGVLGHDHPRWQQAVQEQVARLTHVGSAFPTSEINRAMAKLAEVLPPALDRAVFLNTGSEAVELALKMALAAADGDTLAVMERGYYGATTGALALSEFGRTAGYLPSPGHVLRLPLPHCQRCPAGRSGDCGNSLPCLDALEKLADGGEGRLSAVMYEPVLGGGIFVPPAGYGKRLRELTTRAGALLIAEEVTTGIGRTGRWFGFEHEQIVPDILIIGKAIGAGLPVSAVITTAAVEERCMARMGRHVQSHQNDPFSGAVAAAVIATIQEENLVERAERQGRYLMQGLRALQAEGPWLQEVRGLGLMLGAQLAEPLADKGPEIARRMLEEGFIVEFHAPTSTFRLFPPYVISSEEIDSFLSAFGRVLRGM